jgi:predicted O-linked N-acetylglucosamine transferase (SPINDLY family)
MAREHQRAGRRVQAETICRAVLERDGRQPDALHLLALARLPVDPGAAMGLARQAVDIEPGRSWYHATVAAAALAAGDAGGAAASYRRAVGLDPTESDLQYNLSLAYRSFDRAVALNGLRRCLAIDGWHGQAWTAAGLFRLEANDGVAAVRHFRRALAAVPQLDGAFSNLAICSQAAGRTAENTRYCQRAAALSPREAKVLANLSGALTLDGRMPEAMAALTRAREIDPGHAAMYSNYLFLMNYLPGYDFAAHGRENRAWGRWVESQMSPPPPAFDNDRNPDRRLRLAYISPEFLQQQNQLAWVLPLLQHHNRERFEIYSYADVAAADAATRRIGDLSDCLRIVGDLDDAAKTETIRRDGIDIAVNLCGWMAAKRALFARRLAPVQVAYDNHVSTTGLRAMDYRITDAWLDPPGVDEFYSERLIRLRTGYSNPLPPEEAPPIDPLPANDNGFVTFGTANHLGKISDETVVLWGRILACVPRSKILVKAAALHMDETADATRRRFARLGVPTERLILVGPTREPEAHFRAIGRIDIGLDPFPFNGGKSTADMMWMGVPVVALAGDSMMSRVGVSLVTRAGFPELVAPDAEGYVDRATELASDLGRLATLRRDMRRRLKASILGDFRRHTREVEEAYRAMWRDWIDGCVRPETRSTTSP